MGSPNSRPAWSRLVLEGAVIVGSILLALAADAWWDRTQDKAQARSLLVALLDDFEAAAAELDLVEGQHRELAENGERLLLFGENGTVPVEDRETVDFLLGSHFLRPTFDPPMGTVESLLASGRLDLFDNEPLIAGLTNWAAAVESLQRTQVDAREHFYDRLYPYLVRNTDLEDLDKGYVEFLPRPMPFEQGETNAHELLQDQELLNILYMHWVFSTNAAEIEIPVVRDALEEIRSEIEREIG